MQPGPTGSLEPRLEIPDSPAPLLRASAS
jgi:hypothetical protein